MFTVRRVGRVVWFVSSLLITFSSGDRGASPTSRDLVAVPVPVGTPRLVTPLVLALDDDSDVSFAADTVRFDVYGTGDDVLVSWPARRLGLLALDRNGNDRVDDGRELFGDATPVEGDASRTAEHGYAALAQYDADGSGDIAPADPVWPRLRLWVDGDENGRCDGGELRPLAEHGVAALSLAFEPRLATASRRAATPLLTGTYRRTPPAGPRLMADVWLRIRGE